MDGHVTPDMVGRGFSNTDVHKPAGREISDIRVNQCHGVKATFESCSFAASEGKIAVSH